MKKLLFIINIHSGKGGIRNKLLEILDLFVKEGYELSVYTTQGPREATAIVAGAKGKYDRVVCSGGDGTLNEVVTGMMAGGFHVPIGYIPAGSTNDFGSSLGISKRNFTAAKTAIFGKEFACDVGQFNDRYFVYVAAFGAFSDVSYETPQDLKNVLGHTAYLIEGMKRINTIEAYSLKVQGDDQVYEGDFIYGMITNSTSVGGMKNLLPEKIQLDDGLFEVTLIRQPPNLGALSEIVANLAMSNVNHPLICKFKASHLFIESKEDIKWTVDGENGGVHKCVELVNHHKAVTFVVPDHHSLK